MGRLGGSFRAIILDQWFQRRRSAFGCTDVARRSTVGPNSHCSRQQEPTLEYDKAKERSTAYFHPKKNSVVEDYKFRSSHQHSGETIEKFSTRLCILSKGCKFHDVEREITTAIIQNCLSDRFWRDLLEVPDIKLDVVLKMGHVFDTVESNALFFEGKSIREEVNYVTRPIATPTTPGRSCFTCSGNYSHPVCPAKSKEFKSCGELGNFSRVCSGQDSQNPNPTAGMVDLSSVADEAQMDVHQLVSIGFPTLRSVSHPSQTTKAIISSKFPKIRLLEIAKPLSSAYQCTNPKFHWKSTQAPSRTFWTKSVTIR